MLNFDLNVVSYLSFPIYLHYESFLSRTIVYKKDVELVNFSSLYCSILLKMVCLFWMTFYKKSIQLLKDKKNTFSEQTFAQSRRGPSEIFVTTIDVHVRSGIIYFETFNVFNMSF